MQCTTMTNMAVTPTKMATNLTACPTATFVLTATSATTSAPAAMPTATHATPVATNDTVLGKSTLSTFTTIAMRNKKAISSGCAQYFKADCIKHNPKESLALVEKATAGTNEKIAGINYEKIAATNTDNFVFENNVKVETFLHEISAHLVQFDMIYLFKKFPLLRPTHEVTDKAQCLVPGATISLINKWDQIGIGKAITTQQITYTIKWLHTYLTASFNHYI
eukprot:8575381-Ditylum_brightwellii.AAC.1